MEPIKSSPSGSQQKPRLGDQFAIYAADLKLIGTGAADSVEAPRSALSFWGMEKPWKRVIFHGIKNPPKMVV
jgi:hypothetical protein